MEAGKILRKLAVLEGMIDKNPHKVTNFYLDYQLIQKKEDKDIGIFYPASICDVKNKYL